MKAIAYLRVSSTGQAAEDKDGLPRQRAAVAKFAEANGHVIARTFVETYTGTKLGERKALALMLAYLEYHPETEAVLIENLDRLARDTLVGLLLVKDLKACGVAVLTTDGRDAAEDDPTSKLITTILMGLAAYQRDMLVMRMALGRLKRRAAGKRCEGRRPYGSKPTEAVVLVAALALRAAGSTLGEIARWLNDSGHLNTIGKPWTVSSVSRLVRRDLPDESETLPPAVPAPRLPPTSSLTPPAPSGPDLDPLPGPLPAG